MIYFDGICNLCNGAVDWVLKKDKSQSFLFCSLQSASAKVHLPEERIRALDTVVVKTFEGKIFLKSEAALFVLAVVFEKPWIYKFGSLIPRFLRDGIYQIIARFRYQIFGQRETCRIPTPQERARFLD